MSAKNLQAIQVLRGVAATGVICHHLADTVREHSTLGLFWARWFNTDVGSIGVDLFFIISGFIMAYTTQDGKMSAGSFLYRRGVRIFPLYWFYSFLVLGVYFVLPWAGRVDASPGDIAKSFILYPTLTSMDLLRPAILPQGWTLSFELFFYLVFALFIPLALGRRVIVVTAVLFLVQVTAFLIPGKNSELVFLRDDTLLEFCFGLGIAYIVLRTRFRVGLPGFVALLVLALLALFPELFWIKAGEYPIHRILRLGLSAALTVAAFTWYSGPAFRFPRWATLLGDASYTIYLLHVILLTVATSSKSFDRFIDADPNTAYGLLLAVILVLGVALYYLVEKPLLLLSRGKRKAPPVNVDPAAVSVPVGARIDR